MQLPVEILELFNLFCKHDYHLYLVGGAIRNAYLKISTTDYDFTTNALPNELVKLLVNYPIKTNALVYGNVHFKLNDYEIAITTMRQETNYLNHRQPSNISFIDDLYLDSLRRDFTINAIYFNQDYIDYHHGLEDLNNRQIRCVNSANRLLEDYLRMLRAIRFSLETNFEIAELEYNIIKTNLHLVKELPLVSLRSELAKILLKPNYQLLNDLNFFKVFFNTTTNLNASYEYSNLNEALQALIDNLKINKAILSQYDFSIKKLK